MGVLIYFPERPETTRRSEDVAGTGAQILFFTGIRYERHEDAMPAAKAGRQARPAIGETARPRRRRG
jgi:hypothetical protein